jgi:general secretion pathway protein A
MYLEYWGLKKFPFDNVPDPEFFYLSKPHEEGLARLIYAVKRKKGCALLSGDPGSGKTILSKVFLQRIERDKFEIGIISNPCTDTVEFLQDILYKLDFKEVPNSKVQILQVLSRRLNENVDNGKETLLIIDEAQLLTSETLEEVRLLLNFQISNRFLLTIFLMGQPELLDKIKKIKQLEQRIAIKYYLRPFNFKETAKYVLFRMKRAGISRNVFTKQAIDLVFRHSSGLPRLINNLCDLALLVGSGEKREVISSDLIKDVLGDGAVF